ncbi:MAG: hypothetical protein KDE31_07105, partial [Caldilineaceae bacterium]|nr:hypothetical protein [Caldilineaceae bacterium]
GKVALLKTMTTALALKADAETLISPLEDAVDALAAAMQLADDIEDWVEDYQCRRYTLPLTWAIPEMTGSAPQLAVAEVRQRLDESVILETLVKQIIEWFEDALTSVSTLHASCWIAFVENCLQKTRSYQQTLVAQKVRSIMSGSLHFHESNPFPSTPA